jgi:hypothetical protein
MVGVESKVRHDALLWYWWRYFLPGKASDKGYHFGAVFIPGEDGYKAVTGCYWAGGPCDQSTPTNLKGAISRLQPSGSGYHFGAQFVPGRHEFNQ